MPTTDDRSRAPDPSAAGFDPELDTASGSRGPIVRLGRGLAAVAVIASFGVWAYAYSGFADRPPPDLLEDIDLAVRAEAVCAAAVADVEAMPGAQDAVDELDRSRQVLASTDRFEAMVADLEGLDVVAADDRVIMTGWLGDWRTLLDDRRRYAAAVADNPEATFFLTNVAPGERLDRRLTRVADVNRMSSCGAPTDVG